VEVFVDLADVDAAVLGLVGVLLVDVIDLNADFLLVVRFAFHAHLL
jgi:hypothetical protein